MKKVILLLNKPKNYRHLPKIPDFCMRPIRKGMIYYWKYKIKLGS